MEAPGNIFVCTASDNIVGLLCLIVLDCGAPHILDIARLAAVVLLVGINSEEHDEDYGAAPLEAAWDCRRLSLVRH